jgi:hypothetical protein|tara:strand:+ start:258 stop:749 length:492 start_codon:yes stop_codon:yes gene_type:complete
MTNTIKPLPGSALDDFTSTAANDLAKIAPSRYIDGIKVPSENQYKYYKVSIKNIEIRREGIFDKSPLGAVNNVLNRISKIYDLNIIPMNNDVINYSAEVDEIKTAEHEKAKAEHKEDPIIPAPISFGSIIPVKARGPSYMSPEETAREKSAPFPVLPLDNEED